MHSIAICAVVVLYFPDEGVRARLSSIMQQTDMVVVVDNSGSAATGSNLGLEGDSRIHFIHNTYNRGVATALNQGVLWAEQHGFELVLLFDQDTEPMEKMSKVLLDVYHECSRKGENTLIGANYVNGLGDVQIACQGGGERWVEQKTIITSGTLLSLDVYHILGPLRDEFFIDAVDYDYCLKARSKGIGVVLSCEALMRHTIGMQTRHRLLWKKTAVSNHSALRRYYMFRNNFVLMREYWLSEPSWVLNRMSYLLKTIVLLSCFEKNKLSKLAAVISGLWHGVIGKVDYVRN